MLLNKNTPKG